MARTPRGDRAPTRPEPLDPFGRLSGRVEDDGDAVLLALSGEIDEDTSGALVLRLPQIAAAGSGDVVLDMAMVTFIDSSGLRALLDMKRRMTSDGRRLVMRNASGAVRRLMDLSVMGGLLGCE